MASRFNWTECFDLNIDSYASNITEALFSMCGTCIPNKIVTSRTSKPTWFHNDIRKAVRHRKIAYDHAKRTIGQYINNNVIKLSNLSDKQGRHTSIDLQIP
jgi:hypothetical protein